MTPMVKPRYQIHFFREFAGRSDDGRPWASYYFRIHPSTEKPKERRDSEVRWTKGEYGPFIWDEPESYVVHGERVAELDVPKQWRKAIQKIAAKPRGLEKFNEDRNRHIDFKVSPDGKTAVVYNYFPKPDALRGLFGQRGWGYYIEALGLSQLKKQGVTRVRTTDDALHGPTRDRESQLKAVGLPIGKEVPIDVWLKAMGKGIKQSKENRLWKKTKAAGKYLLEKLRRSTPGKTRGIKTI